MSGKLGWWIGLGWCLGAMACGQADQPGPAPGVGEVRLLVTVDWEGRDLAEENLAAMTGLREAFPQLPLVQFLNAAYFTKPEADAALVAQRMNSVLRDGDELGLHVHGWQKLFEAAGVTFRNTPTVWGGEGGMVAEWQCKVDCGHEVPINAYTQAELEAVFGFSLNTLQDNGFGRARSFRTGAWLGEAHVLNAVVSQGMLFDSSAVAAPLLAEEIGDTPLYEWVAALWQGTDIASQPYALAGLTEVPDNGALADYVSDQEMFSVYQAAKQRLADDPQHHVVVNIGFHQETAADYLPRVQKALELILADAEANGVPLKLTTMERVGDP